MDSSIHAAVRNPLLETKLCSPRWRAEMVSRPRLVEQLQQGVKGKLTLVSAPAGSGKSTLLAEWLAGAVAGHEAVAWLSLDASENDTTLFWSYVIAALQTQQAGIGEGALALIYASSSPPVESIITVLLNDLNTVERDIVLMLDDYHVIDSEQIHKAMAFMVEHLPRHVHLVIAKRPRALASLDRAMEYAQRLIAAGMRNQEIADHLFISLATVKRHISNVYGKLEVTHRTEAVAYARELNLL